MFEEEAVLFVAIAIAPPAAVAMVAIDRTGGAILCLAINALCVLGHLRVDRRRARIPHARQLQRCKHQGSR